MLRMKWLWFVPILSIFLKLQAVKQSGPGFLVYPVYRLTARVIWMIDGTLCAYSICLCAYIFMAILRWIRHPRQWPGLRPLVIRTRPVCIYTKNRSWSCTLWSWSCNGLGLVHCGLGLGLADLVLFYETRSWCFMARSIVLVVIMKVKDSKFQVLCLERHYYGDQQWRVNFTYLKVKSAKSIN